MLADLKTALRPALVMTLLFAGLLGIAYPLAMTGIGQMLFPAAANGSLVLGADGKVIGSTLIGQGFASPRYFHGRPSAAGKGYDATASSGSNLAPDAQALADRLKTDIAALHAAAPSSSGRMLAPDLVTASASGLDPDISPEAAFFQVDRVAAARGIDPATLRALIAAHTGFSWFGDHYVRVLTLNRALDATPARP